jgi:hypothetical protein
MSENRIMEATETVTDGEGIGVEEYIAGIPEPRRSAIQRVREVINAYLPDGYREGMAYGMIGWFIPLERYPDTYNGQPLGLVALANQKAYMSLYLNCVYGDATVETRFRERWAATGKKLDMGKSCVRFRALDDLALDVIGDTIARTDVASFIAAYEAARARTSAGRKAATRRP